MSKPPLIAFRTDASSVMGIGHVKRCLALAAALQRAGASTHFITRSLGTTHAADLISRADHTLTVLPQPQQLVEPGPGHSAWAGVGWNRDATETAEALATCGSSWLVVDHYSFDAHWHRAVRSALCCRIAAIDDLADRALEVDLIVDHNWADNHQSKYADVNLRSAGVLGGPRYALLAPAFADVPPIKVAAEVRSVGVFMGGADPRAASVLALEALDAARFRGETEVVTTSANPLLEKLAIHVALRPKTRLTVDCEDLAAFFARHDLQIGAGGGATWERCRLGAPTVALILASNQEPVLQALVGQGVLTALPPGRTSVEQLAREITLLLGDFDLRQRYSERSARLVDGGGATRVARELLL